MDDDPGPIWEHLPGDWRPAPATGEVVEATRPLADIEAGLRDPDGEPSRPGATDAFRRGLATVLGQPRLLAIVIALLVMLLAPVLPVVSGPSAAYLITLLPVALMPLTYIRRDGATARVSLAWLSVVAAGCYVAVATPFAWVWWFVQVPLVAIAAAAWATGSWRQAVVMIVRLFRRTWLGTLGMTQVVSIMVLLLLGVPMYLATQAFGDDHVDSALLATVSVTYVVVLTACAIGYALVAVDETRR